MKLNVVHLPSDYSDAPSVDELLSHLAQETGITFEADENETEADHIPGYDDGEAEPSNDEPANFE